MDCAQTQLRVRAFYTLTLTLSLREREFCPLSLRERAGVRVISLNSERFPVIARRRYRCRFRRKALRGDRFFFVLL